LAVSFYCHIRPFPPSFRFFVEANLHIVLSFVATGFIEALADEIVGDCMHIQWAYASSLDGGSAR
jgi:hypothetical protein